MRIYNPILAVVAITLISCTDNPERYIEHIEGYWQIERVEKHKALIMAYTSTGAIDYFKINADGSGFRKKVTPTMEGTLLVSDHSVMFNYRIENDSLNIYYNEDANTFKETIKRATETELVITNSRGFKYTYVPYKSEPEQ
jgi:hypothetical protein